MTERETALPLTDALTAEELAFLRSETAAEHYVGGAHHLWNARLLATLDAARAGDEGLTAGQEKFIEDEAVAAFYRAHINHVYHSQKGRDTALARDGGADSWRVPVRAAVKAVLAALRATDTGERRG